MALDAIIHRKRPSWWHQFQQAPLPVLARTLYAQRQRLASQAAGDAGELGITVVCVSDTHNSTPELPPGDLLLHAGDLTQGGTVKELQDQLDWLNKQPHTYKVIIAGNHDIVLDGKKSSPLDGGRFRRSALRWGSVYYLERNRISLSFSSGVNLSLFGHPCTRRQGAWAFQYDRGTDVFSNQVDEGTDILITHSPPRFHLDVAGWGDEFLLHELWRVRPRLHVFGHIHEGYGRDTLIYDEFERLYERVCAASAGVFALLRMLLLGLYFSIVIGSSRHARKTVLINASVVGGLIDEHQRKVQVVHL